MGPTSGAFVSDPVGIGLITTHPGDGPPSFARSWPGAAHVVVEDASDCIAVDTVAGCAGAELVMSRRSLGASVPCGCWHDMALPLSTGQIARGAIGWWLKRPCVQAIGQSAAWVVDLVFVVLPHVAYSSGCGFPHAAYNVVGRRVPTPRWEAVCCVVKEAHLVQNGGGNRGVVLCACCFQESAVLHRGSCR